MLWRGAAAAADDIEKACFCPFTYLFCHRVGVEIVFTKGVGQPGVRVGGDVAFRNTRQFLYVLAQFVWPQRTVQAKGQRFGVAQGVVKRFSGLPGERAPGGVGDGARDHNRQFNAQRFKLRFHRKDRRFGVKGVENGFNQDQIRATFHQRFGGFSISRHQLVKSDVAECRIVDVRRNRRRAVGRAENTGNVARFLRRARGPLVSTGARQFRRRKVDFRRQGFHLVIRHRNSRGVEGVGFDDIRARFKVGVVDSGDHFRFAEHQQVVVAFEIAWPVGKAFTTKIGFVQSIALDHGAHTAVQHQNTFI